MVWRLGSDDLLSIQPAAVSAQRDDDYAVPTTTAQQNVDMQKSHSDLEMNRSSFPRPRGQYSSNL